MKMIMPLLAPASGKIRFVLPEGSVMNSGDLIATMELDDPEAITKATPYTGSFPELGPPIVHSEGVDHRFKEAYTACKNVMAGEELLRMSAAGVSFQPKEVAWFCWGVTVMCLERELTSMVVPRNTY